MAEPVRIAHFSDVLCVWAYVSQVRIDELRTKFGDRVKIERYACNVFGDTQGKLVRGWAERGGMQGYASHVREVVARFDHVEIHADVWSRVRPRSSLPCHVYLSAVRRLGVEGNDPGLLARTSWAFREAFFAEGRDISDATVRREIASAQNVDTEAAEHLIANGSAYASLSADLALCREKDVRVSPTVLLNEGRQRLNGNVGYRIIEANVLELLEQPSPMQSWC